MIKYILILVVALFAGILIIVKIGFQKDKSKNIVQNLFSGLKIIKSSGTYILFSITYLVLTFVVISIIYNYDNKSFPEKTIPLNKNIEDSLILK